MNEKAVRFLKNVGYAVGANVSRIVTTFFITLLLPRLMTLEDYSYWQLYGFYGIYLTHSSIGWCEGTYLKYGGADYRELDGRKLASQFWNMAVYEGIFALVCGGLFLPFLSGFKLQAFGLSLVYMWAYILRYQLQTVLQATGKIGAYARIFTGERLLNFLLVMACILMGTLNFQMIAGAEIVSNLCMLAAAMYMCREVTLRPLLPLKESLKETKELIAMGYKLTLAGLASQLIIGIVRFAIEQRWGTLVFGKISLSFSMANMMITCISAVSIVMFPMLRRADGDTLKALYQPVRTCMTVFMFGLLACYAPAKAVLGMWLPKYADSLRYLAILFPLCVYETRNMVLVWTYLKTVRRQQDILRGNLAAVAVSLVSTAVTVGLLGNLELAVISIIALYGVKAVCTETLLMRHMGLTQGKNHVLEAMLTAVFVCVSWRLPGMAAFFAYVGAFGLYVVLGRRKIGAAVKAVKDMVRG